MFKTARAFNLSLIAAVVISWVLWLTVFILISPDDLGMAAPFLFLVVFSVAVFITIVSGLYLLRRRFGRFQPLFRQLNLIIREAALLTTVVIINLILAHFQVFSFVYLGLQLLFIVLVDLYLIFIYDRRRQKKTTRAV